MLPSSLMWSMLTHYGYLKVGRVPPKNAYPHVAPFVLRPHHKLTCAISCDLCACRRHFLTDRPTCRSQPKKVFFLSSTTSSSSDAVTSSSWVHPCRHLGRPHIIIASVCPLFSLSRFRRPSRPIANVIIMFPSHADQTNSTTKQPRPPKRHHTQTHYFMMICGYHVT